MKLPFSNFNSWNMTLYGDMYIDPNSICPDRGLRSISNIAQPNILVTIAWMGAFFSMEQAIHAILIFLHSKNRPKFYTRIDPFVFPTGIALLWVLFTAVSHILVGFTWRSNAAVLTKTLHVATEATFLVQLCMAFGFYGLAAAALLVVFIILTMVFTLPCSATIGIASLSGIALDSTNFLAFVYLGCTKRKNREIWMAISAFGFHVLYLMSLLFVQNYDYFSDYVRGSFRLSGMVFNIIASEIFLRLVHMIEYDPDPLIVDTEDWIAKREIVSIWTEHGLIIKGYFGREPMHINVFDPYVSGYSGCMIQILNAYIPLFGNCVVSHYDDKHLQLKWSFLFAFCVTSKIPKRSEIPDRVLVLTWNYIRLPFQILFVLCGLMFSLL
tara:strand:- start:1047 stop:2195 length:1149 start_codon:yes stop_codon:yes gene_type:complete